MKNLYVHGSMYGVQSLVGLGQELLLFMNGLSGWPTGQPILVEGLINDSNQLTRSHCSLIPRL